MADQKTDRCIRRKNCYPKMLSLRVSENMAQRIETLAVKCGATLGEIARHALDAGLPVVEGDSLPAEAPSSDNDARRWWETLHRGERRNWSRRLSHLKGPAFFVEAYRKATAGKNQLPENKR